MGDLKLGIIVIIFIFGQVICCHKKKNIVLIMADDMGWNDVSFHGSDEVRTPNMDVLASSGVALQRYYSHAICTPSRSALMTGKFSYRLGMQGYPLTFGEERGLPLTEKILPQYLKEQGYATHLVGKWHLGNYEYAYLPTFRGFDTHYGLRGGLIDFYEYTYEQTWANGSIYNGFDLFRNVTVDKTAEGYATDLFNNEALEIIHNHNKEQPLFLLLSHTAPHCGNDGALLQADPKDVRAHGYVENAERRIYCAMVKKFDDSVGDVIEALQKKNMLGNSIIAVISDNGGPTVGLKQNWASNKPLKGVKATPWEGGTRTVGLLWSKELSKANNIWNGNIHAVDWLPTFLNAIGVEVPEGIDGASQWNNILKSEPSSRNLMVEIDDYSYYSAIIQDNYKLVTATIATGFDGYYGESFEGIIGSPPDYRMSIEKSKAYKIFKNYNLDIDTILQLRDNAQMYCGDKVDNGCIPQKDKVCLYDIVADPCEKEDLSAALPDVVARLNRTLFNEYNQRIPRTAIVRNDNAIPRLHQYNWISHNQPEDVAMYDIPISSTE